MLKGITANSFSELNDVSPQVQEEQHFLREGEMCFMHSIPLLPLPGLQGSVPMRSCWYNYPEFRQTLRVKALVP
jgi:hypothetical protein